MEEREKGQLMRCVKRVEDVYDIHVSRAELEIFDDALRPMALNARGSPSVAEFEGRIGASFAEVTSLWLAAKSFLQDSGTQPPVSEESSVRLLLRGNDWFTIQIRRDQIIILVRRMGELANGFDIPEWEFSTLTGLTRNEIRSVMHELHLIAVLNSQELAEL